MPPDVADRFVAEQAVSNALLDRRVDLDELAADPDRLEALRRGEPALPLLAEGRLPTDRAGLQAALASYLPRAAPDPPRPQGHGLPPAPPPRRAQLLAYQPLLANVLRTLPPEWLAIVDPHRSRAGDAALSLAAIGLLDLAALCHGPTEPWLHAHARASEPSGGLLVSL